MSKLALLCLYVSLCGWIVPPHKPAITEANERTLFAYTDTLPNQVMTETFSFGKPATFAQISTLDRDVRPDGTGLPVGSGTVAKGRLIFAGKCVACHGANGTGGLGGALVTTPNAPGKRPANTIGNYWPYATTVFDYIRRAMPFSEPGSLTDDEVYALTAFLLNANKIVDENIVLNAQTLPMVRMPAQPRFVPDDRRDGPEIH